jgi:hypothetical protein
MEGTQPEKEFASSDNGRIFSCSGCNCIHVEFSTIAMNLSAREFFRLKHVLDEISLEYCEVYFRNTRWKRKIHVQLQPTPINLAFTRDELIELRRLFDEAEAAFAVENLVRLSFDHSRYNE